ncbi:MAG TPA: CmcI family methyltransferase, partial [Candidatus Elarobacter sp.]|nr:CmcI family methyltransferase [Candidatus Elarobacter sp.]
YANLELYERLGSASGVTVCTIVGEGSFHQIHGGTTTNQTDATERRSRVFGYGEHYAELRGRPFKGPGKPIHYVGRMPNQSALRSKPRRMSTAAFAEGASGDGEPLAPSPMPDDLKVAFTDAVWRTLPWTSTTWQGRPLSSAPTDLVAYQELVTTIAPDWVVEVGTGDGVRALFLAAMCELAGHGEVISVGAEDTSSLPRHPRLRYVAGDAAAEETVAEVRGLVGAGTCLVVLGERADRTKTVREFNAYCPLVPVGSYVVVTDTIVNGHPVWPGFGPGPAEAVKQILNGDGRFVADPTLEKYSLTFNPNGFLKRVAP